MQLRKPLKITVYILIGLAALALLIQVVVNIFLSSKAEELLLGQNFEKYSISLEKIRFNIFKRAITIKDFKLIPKDTSLQMVKEGVLKERSAEIISSSIIRAYSGTGGLSASTMLRAR